jgi:CheY-like chemotaxis protein
LVLPKSLAIRSSELALVTTVPALLPFSLFCAFSFGNCAWTRSRLLERNNRTNPLWDAFIGPSSHFYWCANLALNSKQVKMINKKSFVRILLVDDFAAWRDYVLEKLRENSGLQVVGVASDGLEAISKAQALQPDLILLDVGLPKLNGIDAAQGIYRVAPESKIIFLSQQLDLDVGREALRAGGQGYVLKSDAGRDLLVAVEMVMSGRKFLSSRLGPEI